MPPLYINHIPLNEGKTILKGKNRFLTGNRNMHPCKVSRILTYSCSAENLKD
jgi:hypothetical protein